MRRLDATDIQRIRAQRGDVRVFVMFGTTTTTGTGTGHGAGCDNETD